MTLSYARTKLKRGSSHRYFANRRVTAKSRQLEIPELSKRDRMIWWCGECARIARGG